MLKEAFVCSRATFEDNMERNRRRPESKENKADLSEGFPCNNIALDWKLFAANDEWTFWGITNGES